jgi:hypothetical protein
MKKRVTKRIFIFKNRFIKKFFTKVYLLNQQPKTIGIKPPVVLLTCATLLSQVQFLHQLCDSEFRCIQREAISPFYKLSL